MIGAFGSDHSYLFVLKKLIGVRNVAKQIDLSERWSTDDLRSIANRVDHVKEQSGCSLTSVLEIIEVLELLHGMVPDFPLPQQRYFREAADELVGLAIGNLEAFRTNFGFIGRDA